MKSLDRVLAAFVSMVLVAMIALPRLAQAASDTKFENKWFISLLWWMWR